MKMKLLMAAAVLACCGSAAHAAAIAGPNLIEDGDFLNSNATFQTLEAGSALPEGGGSSNWVVQSGDVDLIGGYWQSPTGPNAAAGGTNGSVDLDGFEAGSISQGFNTPVTGEYTLQFYLGGNPDMGPQTVSVSTSETGVADPTYTFNTAGSSHSDMNYVLETETFFAFAGADTLTFASNTPGDAGPVIGGVSVTEGGVSAAPEPATWTLMFAGVAAIGLMLRRARTTMGFRFKDAFAA